MSEMRKCSVCGMITDEWCPECVASFHARTPADQMTMEERIAEMESWPKILEIPFAMMHQRWEELMGRPVWTHEFAYPDQLIAEAKAGHRASMTEIIDKFPKDMPIIIVSSAPGDDST